LWETADADRGNNVFEGAARARTLKVKAAEPPAGTDTLRENDLKVLPDSLQTYPAAPKPVGGGSAAAAGGSTPTVNGVVPPPANAPAVPRGEPATPPSLTPAPNEPATSPSRPVTGTPG
jgi:hypothetical protein